MQISNFPEANIVLGKPESMTDEQCGSLPVYTDGQVCISCWQPSAEELAALNAGQPIWLGVLTQTTTQPPVFVSVGKPEMVAEPFELTPEWEDALRQFAYRLPDPAYAGGKPQTGAELADIHPYQLYQVSGQPLHTEQLYYVSSPEAKDEHLRNLCTLYKRGGKPAVVAYLKPYGEFLHTPDTQPAR